MLDRQKIETVLTRRFSGASASEIAAAANAIMGLGDEWEELDCGAAFRLFRRREPDPDSQPTSAHREIRASFAMRSSTR